MYYQKIYLSSNYFLSSNHVSLIRQKNNPQRETHLNNMKNPYITRINSDYSFNFKCYPEISCFNECCQDLQQVLSPYDIIRLKHHFSCDSSTFLKTYTESYIGPETGLPIIQLKNKSQTDLHCIFVSESGCMVYPDRPSTCRYYPLGRIISKSRETGKINDAYTLIRETHCKGHDNACKQNVDQWRNAQELKTFDKYNDVMINLISAKNKAGLKTLSDDQRFLIYMSCYDIDAFRRYANQQKIFKDLLFANSIEGDIQLLLSGMRWVEEKLFR
jgi:hypothetical protein